MDSLRTSLTIRPVNFTADAPATRPAAPLAESAAPTPTESVDIRPAPPPEPKIAEPQPSVEVPTPFLSNLRAPNFTTTMALLDEPSQCEFESTVKPMTLQEQLQAFVATAAKDEEVRVEMRGLESAYLKKFPYKEGPKADKVRKELTTRYADHRAGAERVHEALEKASRLVGHELGSSPKTLAEMPFDNGGTDAVKKHVNQLVDRFFASEKGSQNPLKARLVKEQSNRYIDLIAQAQQEGDYGVTHQSNGQPKSLSCSEVYQLVARNVAALAVQDHAACENNLGDHGVRHLVGHNIAVCETLLDELEKNGGKVSAKDRLILHQAMIMHDLGYSTQNVRGGINFDGINGQDAGHALLGGRYIREIFQSMEDPTRQVFSNEDFKVMHRCVMYHDTDENGGAGIKVHVSQEPTLQQRIETLESVTRLADNTHAFEDKLPEVLYRNPGSLKMLRLMKAAGELGDEAAETKLQQTLAQQIHHREDLSPSDKTALTKAVKKSGGQSLDFTVRRILGNRPEYAMDPSGKVTVTVTESSIHRDVMGLCGQAELGLLEKYMKDVSGAKLQLQPGMSEVSTPSVDFRLKLGENRAQEMTEFQQQVSGLFTEPTFRSWAVDDNQLGKTQKALEAILNGGDAFDDAAIQKAAAKYLDPGAAGGSREEILEAVSEQLGRVRSDRSGLLRDYMANSGMRP